MGVMECTRDECRNIMCDQTILPRRRYICNDCYRELLRLRGTYPADATEDELVELIERFMDTRPAGDDDPDRGWRESDWRFDLLVNLTDWNGT